MDELDFELALLNAETYRRHWAKIVGLTPAEERANTLKFWHERGDAPWELESTLEDSSTERNSWDALILFASQLLRDGSPLPPGLAEWIAEALCDQISSQGVAKVRARPRLRKHENPPTHLRDHFIMLAMIFLVEKEGMQATRNDEADPVSAADAVAKTFDATFATVKGIWMREKERPRYRRDRDLMHSWRPLGTARLSIAQAKHMGLPRLPEKHERHHP